MKSFSQRIGLKPVRAIIQRESADEHLRNHLWNGLTIYYWSRAREWRKDCESGIQYLLTRIWYFITEIVLMNCLQGHHK